LRARRSNGREPVVRKRPVLTLHGPPPRPVFLRAAKDLLLLYSRLAGFAPCRKTDPPASPRADKAPRCARGVRTGVNPEVRKRRVDDANSIALHANRRTPKK
jgi:hypothetical protein